MSTYKDNLIDFEAGFSVALEPHPYLASWTLRDEDGHMLFRGLGEDDVKRYLADHVREWFDAHLAEQMEIDRDDYDAWNVALDHDQATDDDRVRLSQGRRP